MRITVDIDKQLLQEAMAATDQRTEKATIRAALRKVVILSRQVAALESLRGTGWEGDLDEMRTGWTPDTDWGLQEDK
jgi:Arc/MetJ family transcription regulator